MSPSLKLLKTGVPDKEDLKKVLPSEERIKKGPFAVIECFQEIPCDACLVACKKGAILEFTNINQIPKIDYEKCNGCGLCVIKCPGLAIFVLDYTFSEKEGVLKLAYEFLPLPEKEEEVILLNREGVEVGKGKVVKVQKIKGEETTPLVWISMPKELLMEVRHFKLEGRH